MLLIILLIVMTATMIIVVEYTNQAICNAVRLTAR